eukprot:9076270-Ditylum_brightwellii.AAC.1
MRPVSYVQATHYSSRHRLTHLRALRTLSFEGSPEEWIKFRRGLQAVLKGQSMTQGPASYAVAKTLLKDDTLTVFEQAEITHRNQM